MERAIYKCFFMYQKFKTMLCNMNNFILFVYFLIKMGAFGSKDPRASLVVLQAFLGLNCINYSEKVITGRTLDSSITLFNNLVYEYLKSKSQVQLDQLLCVYKEEFIRREESGRK